RRLGMRWLLLEADRPPLLVEFDDAIALRIADLVPEHRRAALTAGRALQSLGETGAVENVVAERERHVVLPDELAPDDERLRQAVGRRLHGVVDGDAQIPPVAKQPLEALLI